MHMSNPVSAPMRDLICERLKDIAHEENVKILFAIESGSRAWGFHSPDSDYDVRFVYARPKDWHYALGRKRDVIERPIDDELDISGWELSKALTLAMGSNAVIAEWLQSPITYICDPDAVSALMEFAGAALDRKSVTWHYLSLLHRQKERMKGPDGGVRIKRYFYVLRPALALRFMRLNETAVPPMNMAKLRAGCDLSAAQSDALDRLTERKMAVKERAQEQASEPVLDALVQEEVLQAKDWLEQAPKTDKPRLLKTANRLHMELSPE